MWWLGPKQAWKSDEQGFWRHMTSLGRSEPSDSESSYYISKVALEGKQLTGLPDVWSFSDDFYAEN